MDKEQISANAQARIALADARNQEERVNTCMKVINASMGRVESDANIKLIALMKVVCLFLVTELYHLPWREVRTRSFQLFRKALDEIHEKMMAVQSTEENANEP